MVTESPPAFARYIGIDYSGAETPNSSLKGLRVYLADRVSLPTDYRTIARVREGLVLTEAAAR